MPTQTTRRKMQRMATELEIKAVARGQLSQDGPQSVTLRAIAREMGMTAPALYRYFPSRDDLIAAMCEDFFEEITEAISVALAATADDVAHGMHAAIRTFRAWAMAHRNEFALMFRDAEAGATKESSASTQRFAGVFFGLYTRLWAERPFEAPTLTAPAAATTADLHLFAEHCLDAAMTTEGVDEFQVDMPPAALFAFARTWIRLYGVIGMEVFGQLYFMFPDVTSYFESELEDAAAALGIPYVPPVD